MADQFYCVGDIYHGGPAGARLYKDGAAFPAETATDEQLAELRATGALKTLDELAPTATISDALAAKDAEISRLQAALAEANTAKSGKKSAPADEPGSVM